MWKIDCEKAVKTSILRYFSVVVSKACKEHFFWGGEVVLLEHLPLNLLKFAFHITHVIFFPYT